MSRATGPAATRTTRGGRADNGREHRDQVTERLLRRLAQERSTTERIRLRDEIVLLNMAVAESIAARYRHRGAELDDLRQVAQLALVKAVDRYDPSRGSGFIPFAVPTITGEVKRYFRDHCWGIRPTRRIQELQHGIAACEPELTQALGRPPRPSELAEALDIDPGSVVEALACDGYYSLVPLDAPSGSLGGSPSTRAVIDRIGEVDRHLESVEIQQSLAPLLENLTERQKLLLTLRFDRGWTQSQIANELRISQMQVSRLLNALFRQLRRQLEES